MLANAQDTPRATHPGRCGARFRSREKIPLGRGLTRMNADNTVFNPRLSAFIRGLDSYLTGALTNTGRGLTTVFAIHGEKKCDS